jgi:hypothetical protein
VEVATAATPRSTRPGVRFVLRGMAGRGRCSSVRQAAMSLS